jgi:membrane protease subunit HflK
MANYRGFGGNDLPDPKKLLEPFKKNIKLVVVGLIVVLLIVFGTQSFFQVEPEEEAIVLRFGNPIDTNFKPGLHFKIPFVDTVYKVPVQRQHKLEFGRRSKPGKRTKVRSSGYGHESLMLTGDLSLVHVSWDVVYRIDNMHDWLFEIKDHEETIRDISKAVMRQVVGDYTLEEIITIKKDDVAQAAQDVTQTALRDVPTGVSITKVAITNAKVPKAAQKAFDDLTRTLARIKGELSEASAEKKNVLGTSDRERATAIGRAEKRKKIIIGNATGEAEAFGKKRQAYVDDTDLTRQWMYLDVMTRVLRSLDSKIILDKKTAGGGDVVKLLPLKDFVSGPSTTSAQPVKTHGVTPAPTGGK